MKAYLWDPFENKKVRCNLCSHRCVIKEDRRGKCGVRENRSGALETLVYGKLIARHIDPIEKKPLFHFFPGSLSYSIATVGCNFRCLFCQNADIAQMPSDHQGMIMGDPIDPHGVVDAALKGNCQSISYTYTEPTVFFEFAYDTAKLASKKGIRNVFVTNGYMTAEAVEMINPYLDAANVDLKAFKDEYYKELCGARLDHVKDTLKLMKSNGIWVEVTTLIVPGLNDHPAELKKLASFLVDSLGPETPWHISRFHPTYRLTGIPSTPPDSIRRAKDIGYESGLKYVYTGNIPGDPGEKTFCHHCGVLLIDRFGFNVEQNIIKEDRCPECDSAIPGVWS